MREDIEAQDELVDLGAASELTLGIAKVQALEDFETPDFRD